MIYKSFATLLIVTISFTEAWAKHIPEIPALYRYTDRPLTPSHSAFYPLFLPNDALAARLYLIDRAKHTLDVQYYIYEDDAIGKLIAIHLYRAAKRGVKIRILLDDINTAGKDRALATLASHPNIRLRFFNPNPFRRSLRNLALLLELDTLGKRMHNKAIIADDKAAIVGGRNIGDVYYAKDETRLFLDYDIFIIGALVPRLRTMFDRYFDADVTRCASKVIDAQTMPITLEQRHRFLHDFYKKAGSFLSRSPFLQSLRNRTLRLIVAPKSTLYYDSPQKVSTDETDTRTHLTSQIDADILSARRSLILVSPYFIPSDSFIERLSRLRKRGVEVILITNSLSTTDVFPVYSGYRLYLKSLLQMGVKVYELKRNSLEKALHKLKSRKKLDAALHTKMIIVDNRYLIVGSANLDPRSDKLNTETVIAIESRKLSRLHRDKLLDILDTDRFYRLSWERYPFKQMGRYREGVVWTSMEGNRTVRYYSPPDTGCLKSVTTDFLSILPIEGYL